MSSENQVSSSRTDDYDEVVVKVTNILKALDQWDGDKARWGSEKAQVPDVLPFTWQELLCDKKPINFRDKKPAKDLVMQLVSAKNVSLALQLVPSTRQLRFFVQLVSDAIFSFPFDGDFVTYHTSNYHSIDEAAVTYTNPNVYDALREAYDVYIKHVL